MFFVVSIRDDCFHPAASTAITITLLFLFHLQQWQTLVRSRMTCRRVSFSQRINTWSFPGLYRPCWLILTITLFLLFFLVPNFPLFLNINAAYLCLFIFSNRFNSHGVFKCCFICTLVWKPFLGEVQGFSFLPHLSIFNSVFYPFLSRKFLFNWSVV